MDTIHGHKLLDILSEMSLTKEELETKLMREYGENIRFHTCKSEGLNFDELLNFLIHNEKIVNIDGKFAINLDNECS